MHRIVLARWMVLWLVAPLLACAAYHEPELPNAPLQKTAVLLGPAAVAPPLHSPEPLSHAEGEFLAQLRADLAATGLFVSVGVGEAADADAILIRPEWEPRGACFAEPMLTILTVGVIPYVGCYETGYRLTLSGPRFSREVVADNRAKLASVLGWVAGPIVLLPDWSLQFPEEEERQSIRLSILGAVETVSAEGTGTTP